MALPASGQITLNQVNVELGNSGTAQIDMNSSAVRGLFGIASGEIEMSDGYGKSNVAWYGSRAIAAGGFTGSRSNTMDYVTIATTGNASDFGDYEWFATGVSGCSDGSRGLMVGGRLNQTNYTVTLNYFDCDTTGNATDFGDMTEYRGMQACVSNGTRCATGGGNQRSGTYGVLTNRIDYVTIQTTGNAIDFGDLTVARQDLAACSDGSRGVFGGGSSGNTIDYITIATTGNAIDFGDLGVSPNTNAGVSGGTRGVIAGEYSNAASIYYFDIQTTANASLFGNLSVARSYLAGGDDDSRGVFMGGLGQSVGRSNIADYITISTTGNATDFGDMTIQANSRGGLGGGS